MPKYNTRQRQLLMDYLSAHTDESLTAADIAQALSPEGVSVSAVYRNLSDLEADGRLQRSSRTGKELRYRYKAETCRGCLHLSCTRCGRTYHMDRDGADQLVLSVARREGFAVDRAETVLYGICENCRCTRDK